ncbi:hypothetical protein RZS08_02695, partial [Arthrospira platensis SPKY1]|nr:hypothetical protein [Arthrospira platensis SPKY1]
WKFGEGRVVVFTSDANGRWSLPWLRWNRFASFWTELVENVKSQAVDKKSAVDFDLRYTVVGKSLVIDLAIFDPRLDTQAPPQVQARVEEPGKEIKQLVFNQQRKGRFEASID